MQVRLLWNFAGIILLVECDGDAISNRIRLVNVVKPNTYELQGRRAWGLRIQKCTGTAQATFCHTMDIRSKKAQSSKSPCRSLILEKYKHIDNLNSQHFDSGYEQVIATKIPCSTMHFGENCALPRCSGFKNIFVRARQKQISRHFFDPCMLLYCDFCLKCMLSQSFLAFHPL